MLAEHYSNKILLSQNEKKKIYPASVTKMMTVLLVLEEIEKGNLSLEEMVDISERASSMGGSQIFLSAGDKVSVEDLLIGVIVASANDAAVALAEHVSGSVESFVDKMNKRAFSLGMENTNFVNPTGLHDDEHYTTAADLLLLSKKILEYPIYHKWATIWLDEHFLKGKIRSGEVFLSNTNRLIFDYPGCDGLKTGWTDEAGFCLVATAKRSNTRLITLVLGAPSDRVLYDEVEFLLNYGFSNFENVLVFEKGAVIDTFCLEKALITKIDAITESPFYLLVKKGYEASVETEVFFNEDITLPIEKGDLLGKVEIRDRGELRGSVNILAAESVPRANYFQLFVKYWNNWIRFGR
ncbi:MAG: D-alanyl-D-alanine carboxypeptidase [Firmicutes bacterium]|nr:D-alanyl-D-alanine carboxypeptidase [Bacillota bacterium]